MTNEMRQTLARLPYAEKLRRVAALIEFSKRFKTGKKVEQPLSSEASRITRMAEKTTKVPRKNAEVYTKVQATTDHFEE